VAGRTTKTATTKGAPKRRPAGATKTAAATSSAGAKVDALIVPQSKGSRAEAPKLLSGGNPQIPKGDGDAPVQGYIAAMPGWKRDVGRRLDALVTRTVPDVRKAVKWNSPFYGIGDEGWFLAFHCFTMYVKVTFFRGASLRPLPPVESKDAETRYGHIAEDGRFDERQMARWIRQAAKRPRRFT